MSAPTEVEILRAEVAHWESEYNRVAAALRRVEMAAQTNRLATPVPPEPPVGTRYVEDGVTVWEHREDGWYCARVDCPNCAASWVEVLGHLRDGAVRVLPADEEAHVDVR